MKGEKEDGKSTTVSRNAVLVALISAIIGGAGGPFILVKLGANPFRSDPYTGADAALLEQRITYLEQEVGEHKNKHPDQTGHFDERLDQQATAIAVLQTQMSAVLSNQRVILEKLE